MTNSTKPFVKTTHTKMGSNGVFNHPIRSISLPSRLNPNSLHFEEELSKLRSWESSSSSSIQAGLVRVAEMYNAMAETIQGLNKNQQASLIEEALEGSVELLDTCGSAKDLILMMQEQVQDLQSVLRRRPGRDSSIEAKIGGYIFFRKRVKKEVSKCLRALKKMEQSNNVGACSLLQDHALRLLRELREVVVSIFKSIMVFLSEPKVGGGGGGGGGWSLVRRLVATSGGSVVVSDEKVSEVGGVDCALQCLYRKIKRNDGKVGDDVLMVQGRLERAGDAMKDLESGLDRVFRCLIQNRVALLNVLTF